MVTILISAAFRGAVLISIWSHKRALIRGNTVYETYTPINLAYIFGSN